MMMSNRQAISIPETCNQSWAQMEMVHGGRHCGQCCKTVVDFTQMSNAEIIGLLSQGGHICARIDQYQLDSLNHVLANSSERRFKWRGWVAAASVMALMSFSKADVKAKAVYATTQAPVKKQLLPKIDTVFTTISGKVSFSDGKKKMINIRVRGTNIVDVTDKNGRFKLRVPLTARVLELSGLPLFQLVDIDPQNKTFYRIELNAGVKAALTDNRDCNKVIMGELSIKPGQKFSKELLLRTAREIGRLDSAELPAPLKMPERGKI